ncbi:hypothetical protein H2204_011307 [Knufia peltigerae]|uniref:Uncharacterized protein n=1 Tax=Knufia peltigerae TaxID=1002370 RepID=A0AA39CTC4_9EURO|nr:hypothetical protein H2204_011307 [Knufia peltigerae]
MGVEERVQGPVTTTEEVQPDNEFIQINHEHAERMDGAFLSIVFSAAIPCGLVVIVTAILLGVIYSKEVDYNRGWPQLQLKHNITSASGLWTILNDWKNLGGDPAVFVDFNPTSLTAIATLTGKVIPYLSSSIMALVAFFVARRIILISKEDQARDLLTPHQMSLLIQLLGGSSFTSLKDCVHYHVKHKKRWISPIPHAFSALAAVTALGIIIPAADTWFATTVTPHKVVMLEKITNSSISTFGRGIYDPNSTCYDVWYYDETTDGDPWRVPCNMEYLTYNQDEHNPRKWSYNVRNANEAVLTMTGLHENNTVKIYKDPSTPNVQYSYLADKMMNNTRDFRAYTFAMKTQCTPMTAKCFPWITLDEDATDRKSLGANYTFQCSPGYVGDLTSNGASLATGLRTTSNTSAGIGFAPDASLSSMVGNDASVVEFASFTNPLHFGAWSLGWKSVPENDYEWPWLDDWDYDDNIFYDDNSFYAWMLNCSTGFYDVNYDWVNGSVQAFNTSLKLDAAGGVVSYPFAAGLPAADLCLDYASARVQQADNATQLADWWGNFFSSCAMYMVAATMNPHGADFEQTRNNEYIATRVPIVPLFVLLGFKFLYCFAVLVLAVAAYHYTNPSESQSVKERLSVKGLAATCFGDGPSHQQVAVKNVEQLFQQPPGPDRDVDATQNGPAEVEANPPPEQKVAMVQTEMGGWQFVKMAAGKVYDTVAPIVERQVMSEATGGTFGAGGQDAAKWVSLVRK